MKRGKKSATSETAAEPGNSSQAAMQSWLETATREDAPLATAAAVEGSADPVLQLGDAIDITQVGELKAKMAAALDAGGGILHVEVGEVQTVDAAGVQLLVALNNEVAKRGRILSWQGRSEALRRAITLLGFAAEFPALVG
jgi:anti-anti-sigma regulatory factor